MTRLLAARSIRHMYVHRPGVCLSRRLVLMAVTTACLRAVARACRGPRPLVACREAYRTTAREEESRFELHTQMLRRPATWGLRSATPKVPEPCKSLGRDDA